MRRDVLETKKNTEGNDLLVRWVFSLPTTHGAVWHRVTSTGLVSNDCVGHAQYASMAEEGQEADKLLCGDACWFSSQLMRKDHSVRKPSGLAFSSSLTRS